MLISVISLRVFLLLLLLFVCFIEFLVVFLRKFQVEVKTISFCFTRCRWWVCCHQRRFPYSTLLGTMRLHPSARLICSPIWIRPVELKAIKVRVQPAQGAPSTTFHFSWKIWVPGFLNGAWTHTRRGQDIIHRLALHQSDWRLTLENSA